MSDIIIEIQEDEYNRQAIWRTEEKLKIVAVRQHANLRNLTRGVAKVDIHSVFDLTAEEAIAFRDAMDAALALAAKWDEEAGQSVPSQPVARAIRAIHRATSK